LSSGCSSTARPRRQSRPGAPWRYPARCPISRWVR